ncbi:MAG: cell wall-binding repeat-containing protein, partial [Firmicutes bacterium]|nr:cell wall-binding repeat-containing protein [Bacillota bacterium]
SINGDKVNSGNVKADFWMNNVASLGVNGERHYERALTTEMGSKDYPLSIVEALFEELHEATVIGKVEGGHAVTYTVVNEGRKITATPASESNARSVWHEIVNKDNIDYGTKADEDSSAIIKAGSYIQVEDMILLAEKDVTVDNLNDLGALNEAIRDAVVYKKADKAIEGVKAYVAEGTILNMGQSYAAWKQNCMSITADVQATQEMKDALQGLKSENGANGMLKALFSGIHEFCDAIDDTTTTVVFSFGHDLTKHEAVGATCEEAGSIEYYECENCGKLFKDAAGTEETTIEDTVIAALEHDWGTPTYTWSGDFSECTATRVCGRDASHVETVTVKTTPETEEPTATENGKTTYTADFDEPFEDQTHEVVIPATGHTWGEPTYDWSEDNGTVTATLPCTDDPTLTVTETVETTWDWVEGKEATCEEPGQKIYKARFGNTRFEEQTKTVDVAALGHDWGEPTYAWTTDHSACTAKSVCKRDDSHVLTENGTVTSAVTTPATCEGEGVKTYTATFKNETVEGLFETQTATEAIEKTGHDWGTPAYTWSDDLETVVAVVICKNNPAHIVVETANVTKTVKDPTCETAGSTVYTATFENELLETQTRTVEIPATGHDWGEAKYTWSEDHTTCTATTVCKNNEEHVLTENGKVTSEATTPATCEEAGVVTYTATFEGEPFATQTATGEIKPLGHDWDTEHIVFEWAEDHSSCTATVTCKRDENHKQTLPCEVTSEVVGNSVIYTATVTFEGEEYTDVVKVDGVLRIYGKDRYKTSLKVAEYYKEIEGLDEFEAVVIATGGNFPDALTGADLAIRKHAPLLMI